MNNQSWQSMQNSQNWGNIYQPQFSTNIVYVTSPEEALMRSNQRNSDNVYFNQDKAEFYRVKVDTEGRKMWQSFSYNMPDPDATAPAFKSDLTGIMERIARLEALLKNTGKTEVENVESNG